MVFPVNGPTTAALIRDLAKIGEGVDVERVERIAAAVNGFVLTLPSAVKAADGAADWAGVEVAHLVEGATMLGGRLYRRKNTPDGIASFGGDGAVYVRRNDPDIAMLLGLGDYAPPMVG
jgi:hypothetical protein